MRPEVGDAQHIQLQVKVTPAWKKEKNKPHLYKQKVEVH